MNKIESLNVIGQALAQYRGTIAEHNVLQEAFKTINELLELNDKNKEEGKAEEKKEN